MFNYVGLMTSLVHFTALDISRHAYLCNTGPWPSTCIYTLDHTNTIPLHTTGPSNSIHHSSSRCLHLLQRTTAAHAVCIYCNAPQQLTLSASTATHLSSSRRLYQACSHNHSCKRKRQRCCCSCGYSCGYFLMHTHPHLLIGKFSI